MPDCYSAEMEELVTEMLRVLAPDVETETMDYISQLRALQVALVNILSGETPVATPTARPGGGGEGESGGITLTPEDEALVRFALGKMDPKSGDAELTGADVLRRELTAIDRELFVWTSGLVQPPGPSGDAQVALVEDSPIAEVLRPA